ncbi:MAG: hypothetical protein IJ762_05115 [Bacteroidaceae bacterium]|nr:hypothetical protein [Bacteroidaceae bacterium]
MGTVLLIALLFFVAGIVIGRLAHNHFDLSKKLNMVAYGLCGVLIVALSANGTGAAIWGALFTALPYYGGYRITQPETVVHRGRNKYTLKCKDCGSENLEILYEDEDSVTYKCKNCGQIVITELRR